MPTEGTSQKLTQESLPFQKLFHAKNALYTQTYSRHQVLEMTIPIFNNLHMMQVPAWPFTTAAFGLGFLSLGLYQALWTPSEAIKSPPAKNQLVSHFGKPFAIPPHRRVPDHESIPRLSRRPTSALKVLAKAMIWQLLQKVISSNLCLLSCLNGIMW